MSNPYPEYKRNTITVPATVVSVSRLQKCEWVGLTAADVHAAFLVCLDKEDEVGLFAQTIEAKLKEKNNA